MYLTAIDFLDKGKNWEQAIKLLEDLREQYQHIFFDYNKLSTVLVLFYIFIVFFNNNKIIITKTNRHNNLDYFAILLMMNVTLLNIFMLDFGEKVFLQI